MIGDDSVRVIRLLGAPEHRCPPSSLAHLTNRFEPGTPRPLVEQTLARLRPLTVGRWVYPRGAGCVTGDGDTEIGIDNGGRVLWIVPATDRQPLRWEDG